MAHNSTCALFHWLGQEPLAGGNQWRLVYPRERSFFQHQSQVSNRFGDVFFELRSCLIDEGLVLRLWLGDPHFYVRRAVYPILKGMGQHNLRCPRDRKKGAYGKIVGGTPIQYLFDDRVLTVHAMILSANPPALVARILYDRIGGPPLLPLPGHCEM